MRRLEPIQRLGAKRASEIAFAFTPSSAWR
jgi:hypothetical protein